MSSQLLKYAAIAGASGVGLGAFGAHALKAVLQSRGMEGVWQTAILYHLVHALALLGLAALSGATASNPSNEKRLGWIGRCWLSGIVAFSGSLYALALGGPKWLGPITPLGGIAFIAGWILVALLPSRRPS